MSAAAHAGLAGIVLLVFGGPRPFEAAAERAITVDIMTQQEAVQEQETTQERAADKQALNEKHAASGSNSTPAKHQAPQQQQQQLKQPEAETDKQPSGDLPSIDVGELLPTYNLRLPADIDARKTIAASLSPDEILGLKAHLRKCWRLPAGVSAGSGTRVVMRVPFSSTGVLAGEPTLVEASAAQDGPAVMRAALAALTACAPYSFLPRDRYKEWRVLDVSFSPREMGG